MIFLFLPFKISPGFNLFGTFNLSAASNTFCAFLFLSSSVKSSPVFNSSSFNTFLSAKFSYLAKITPSFNFSKTSSSLSGFVSSSSHKHLKAAGYKEPLGRLFVGEIYNSFSNPYNINKKECYCKIINKMLENDEELKNKLPINEKIKSDIDLLYQVLKPIVKEEAEELLTLDPEDFLKIIIILLK